MNWLQDPFLEEKEESLHLSYEHVHIVRHIAFTQDNRVSLPDTPHQSIGLSDGHLEIMALLTYLLTTTLKLQFFYQDPSCSHWKSNGNFILPHTVACVVS